MTTLNLDSALAEVKSFRRTLEQFDATIKNLIQHVVKERNIRPDAITSGVKDVGSLADKMRRPGKNYETLTDVKDLVGVRIITYFKSDVEKVAEIIEREFSVNAEHSVDKRRHLDSSTFGYLSVHKVC